LKSPTHVTYSSNLDSIVPFLESFVVSFQTRAFVEVFIVKEPFFCNPRVRQISQYLSTTSNNLKKKKTMFLTTGNTSGKIQSFDSAAFLKEDDPTVFYEIRKVDSSISQAFNCLESELNQISIALEQERQIAEQERQRAEQERQRAEQERQKLEKRLSKTLAELRNWKNEALRLDNKFKELAVNKVCPNCNAVRNVHRCHVCGQEL
jgi:hypothetical protein